MTSMARHPKMRRTGGVLSVIAVCVTAAIAVTGFGQQRPAALPPSAYVEDFDSAWTFIRDTYAYLEEKAVNWEQVRDLLRPRVTAVRDTDEFIGLLEELIEHLYDHHAHLGVNTAASPRLVPTGADLWAVHQDGAALITHVRAGSDAGQAGLRPGMEIVTIGARTVEEAVRDRLPGAVDSEDPDVRDWALRVLLAGRRNAAVQLEVRTDSEQRSVEFQPGLTERPETPLTSQLMDNRFAYVNVHNSLGHPPLIRAWDAALEALRETDGLILDLRDTPSGGDTIVARPLLGRLVAESRPYQRHEIPAEDRAWAENAEPRGPFTYDRPIAVLVGRWTGSMGEGVAIGLDGMDRATVFGSTMAGLRGALYSHSLKHTGIQVRVPAERLYHVDGTPREAFVPPILVEATSLAEDAVLEEALHWLHGQLRPAVSEPRNGSTR